MGEQEVGRACGFNIGGVVSLVLVRTEDIEFYLDPGLAVFVRDALRLKAGAATYRIVGAPDSMEATAPAKQSPDGPFYEVSISSAMGRDNYELMTFCKANTRTRFVALGKDANGITRLYGTPAFPLSITHDHTTGRQGSDRADRPLRLTGKQRDMPPVITETVYLATSVEEQIFITDQQQHLSVND